MITERYHTDWLGAKIAPYVYQVTKEECLDLPSKLSNYALVSMTPEQEEYYQSAKETFEEDVLTLDFDDIGGAIFRLFSALQSIVNGIVPAYFPDHGSNIRTNKTKVLINRLSQLQDKHVVVWVKYRKSVCEVGKEIKEEYPNLNVSTYYGDLNENQKAKNLENWRRGGGVLISTASCGGFGLTLVESHYAFFYTNSFKYSERIQAEDRIHRYGQTMPCYYFDIWVDVGIEDRIRSAIANKADALSLFRSEIDVIKDMDRNELNNLIRAL